MRPSETLIETVDSRELRRRRLTLLELIFPSFAEEIELGRYLKKLLADDQWSNIRFGPHRVGAGERLSHVFDVWGARPTEIEAAHAA
jgi:hypothetical protein